MCIIVLWNFEVPTSRDDRENNGDLENFRPLTISPPCGGHPKFRKFNQVLSRELSQEISSKTVELFPRNSTIHFGYFTPPDGRNHRPHIWQSPKTKKKSMSTAFFFRNVHALKRTETHLFRSGDFSVGRRCRAKSKKSTNSHEVPFSSQRQIFSFTVSPIF
jgi:hypothetical protein